MVRTVGLEPTCTDYPSFNAPHIRRLGYVRTLTGEEGFEPPSCYKRYTPSSKWSKFLQQHRRDRTERLPIPPLPSVSDFKDVLVISKMVEAGGVELFHSLYPPSCNLEPPGKTAQR